MVVIRKAKNSDIKDINKLNFEMHNYQAGLVGRKFSLEEIKHEFINKKDLKERNCYVAETDGRVVGFIAFGNMIKDEWFGRHIYVYEMAVDKKYQREGIGTKLFMGVLNYAKKRNINIKVNTLIKNKKAINFYSKFKFKPLNMDLILENHKV